MSEHAWILENLESYHAGGLEPAERERLEQHTYECPACAQALQEVRGVDHALDALFADVRPQAGLEDRMIQFLRNKPGRNGFTLTWMAAAAAAVVLFGVVGAGASHFLASGELPFPGLIARRDLRADGIEKASGHYMEHAPQASSQAPVFSGEALNQQPAQDWFQASSMEDKSRVSTQTASPASPETGAIVS